MFGPCLWFRQTSRTPRRRLFYSPIPLLVPFNGRQQQRTASCARFTTQATRRNKHSHGLSFPTRRGGKQLLNIRRPLHAKKGENLVRIRRRRRKEHITRHAHCTKMFLKERLPLMFQSILHTTHNNLPAYDVVVTLCQFPIIHRLVQPANWAQLS